MHDYLRAVDIPKYLGFGLRPLSERRSLSIYIKKNTNIFDMCGFLKNNKKKIVILILTNRSNNKWLYFLVKNIWYPTLFYK
jgi:hypothetical protein